MTSVKRLLCLLGLLLCASGPRAAWSAQPDFGEVAAQYPYICTKVRADPVRNRFYALVPSSSSVLVISTDTLKVIANVGVALNPVDMALSADNNNLYVASTGSTLRAVSVVGLNSLKLHNTFATPGKAVAIAAGLDNRVYVSVSSGYDDTTIYQINGETGTTQATFHKGFEFDNRRLAITPDRKTLFAATTDISSGSLTSFDVSTATPKTLQNNSDASDNDYQLVVSNTGKYVCIPSGGGTPDVTPSYGTALFSAKNIKTYYGVLDVGAYPGPLAFSPDDTLVYHTGGSGGGLKLFDTRTFFETKEVDLPLGGEVNDVVVDHTNSYLVVSRANSDADQPNGMLSVIATGAGTLHPTILVPSIVSRDMTAYAGLPFTYQIPATNSPTSYKALDLPEGLGVDTKTGVISGTPTINSSDDTYYVLLSATNAAGTGSAYLYLTVTYDVSKLIPVITNTSLPDAVAGQDYTATVTGTNSPTSYSAFQLPPGLVIDAATGVISGQPATPGTYSVILSVQNSYGTSEAIILTLTVAAPPVAPPVISSAATASAQAGTPFSYAIAATNAPTSYAATGLPNGLSTDANTGLVSGTPTDSGVYMVTLSATNAGGMGTAILQLTVPPALPVLDLIATVPRVVAGSGEAGVLTVTRTGDLSQKLVVRYVLKGNAKDGVDYVSHPGKLKIKGGHDSATIRIVPVDNVSGTKKVKVTLVAGDAYQIGTGAALVKILPAP